MGAPNPSRQETETRARPGRATYRTARTTGRGSGLTGTVVAFTVIDCTIAALLFTDWQVDVERMVS